MDTSGKSSPVLNISCKRFDFGHLSLTEKKSILNMYKEIKADVPEMTTTDIVCNIVYTVGVAKSTVYRTIKEYKETGRVSPSKRGGGRPPLIKAYNKFIKDSVRQIVLDFFDRNEIPTLNKILIEVHSRTNLPKLSRSSLYQLMKHINFKYM